LAVAATLLTACALLRGPDHPRPGQIRLGPERLAIDYAEPYAAEKRALLERINRDRARHGVAPVAYEPRAALVGDLFCAEAARAGTRGHWDAAGRAPYLRWGQAGGVDYHAQNAASFSSSGGSLSLPILDLLLERHEAMMAEQPPDDGHRRTILDPLFTHVGIGIGTDRGEFRMTEEFTRVAFEWVEVPRGPLPPGATATLAAKALRGWEIGLVEIRHEPPPRPILPRDPRFLGAYAYPPVVRALRPDPGAGFVYASGSRGDFAARRGGRFTVSFRLDQGPGAYVVLCYVRRRGRWEEKMHPATAALVVSV
jgi:uncharacterized protein YkwD